MPVLFGFPTRWKDFFDIIFGLILIVLSFSVTIKRRASARKYRRSRKSPNMTPSFVDGIGGEKQVEPEVIQQETSEKENSSPIENEVTPSI